jgi:cytochrome c biogenesis protein CcmG, thiol:disulfide interchange protein DsbE
LPDLGGRAQDIAAYRGKVVLVNFWATWCEPCRAEMPSMNRLRAALAGAQFEILAVNVGEPQTRIERFLEQIPLDFPVLLDRDTAAAKAWKARILPASFLIGADGRIRYSHLGEIDWTRTDVRQLVERMLPR